MALQMETIRATADRIAASHGLDLVDLEFSGGAKHRALRVFVEKNAEGRAKLAALVAAAEGETLPEDAPAVPKGIPAELLSGVTHEDCATFATDFGTILDVEDLIPGAEYTLEVSSPGLERKLLKPADYERFKGSLAKVQTFSPIEGNRHFTGRLIATTKSEAGLAFTLDLSAVKPKGKPKKAPTTQTVDISLANVEKAHLVAEI